MERFSNSNKRLISYIIHGIRNPFQFVNANSVPCITFAFQFFVQNIENNTLKNKLYFKKQIKLREKEPLRDITLNTLKDKQLKYKSKQWLKTKTII